MKDPKDNGTGELLPVPSRPGRKPVGARAKTNAEMVKARHNALKNEGWKRVWVSAEMVMACEVAADQIPEIAEPLRELIRRHRVKRKKVNSQ